MVSEPQTPDELISVEMCSFVRIQSASIRDNILFSHEYDDAFYNVVLDGMFSSLDNADFFLIISIEQHVCYGRI